jgi:hypothetical protein
MMLKKEFSDTIGKGIKPKIQNPNRRLEEMERSYQVQLMRVKEIVRSH